MSYVFFFHNIFLTKNVKIDGKGLKGKKKYTHKLREIRHLCSKSVKISRASKKDAFDEPWYRIITCQQQRHFFFPYIYYIYYDIEVCFGFRVYSLVNNSTNFELEAKVVTIIRRDRSVFSLYRNIEACVPLFRRCKIFKFYVFLRVYRVFFLRFNYFLSIIRALRL